ncbi:terminase large subunit domain-containing protein [Tuwongella immobilis]|uniref:Uncharacterized protein n=1 Tax=Tuwongella immobilis TaxID=692036 RepID=A0A6C2YXI9_9BACT|nr:terminase family protein [Tuwongella immobilis]VIP05589.1 Phage terminase, large subunit OS=Geomicrobium sp. JCM 19039 GN=JCM19039_1987 PE=4 SV=1: Terminase_6 [Tuwongella immobilis]VTS08533.1 Phage terminase, large subunit OS=Geomicrobium sp. JCM 19039 GN=JCM19039_1987 PE=4 SV=1: Terminase_6 [Tuwongella immobilis]
MSSSPKSQEAAAELLRRRQARRDLLEFVRYTKGDYEPNWHHASIARKLDDLATGRITRLMVFAPPRHGKSELVSRRFPAYLLGSHPNTSIIACAHTAELASDMNRDVQQCIMSPEYQRLFPGTSLRPGRANSSTFETVSGGRYICAGVGGPITGRGGDMLIIDDIFKNAEEANSPTIRSKIRRWYETTFRTRAMPGARILITLTRWHPDDLAGQLQALMGSDRHADQWEVLCLPALAGDGTPSEIDPRSPGEALWPARFPVRALMAAKAGCIPADWLALYQQAPIREGGNHFRRDWFRRCRVSQFDTPGDSFILMQPDGSTRRVKREDCQIIVTADPATSEKEHNDPTAIGVYAMTPSGDLLALSVTAEHLDLGVIPERLVAAANAWGATYIALESDGFQVSVARATRTVSGCPAVRELSHEGKGKLSRAIPAIIRAQSGQIYLLQDADGQDLPWVAAFLDECEQFTGLAGNRDDRVDTLAYAVLEMPTLAANGPTWVAASRRARHGASTSDDDDDDVSELPTSRHRW